MGARRCQPGTMVPARWEGGRRVADPPGLPGRRCETWYAQPGMLVTDRGKNGQPAASSGRLPRENDRSMDIPQVGDQARKAPTQAIRAVFAGIGKLLLAADRPQPGTRPGGPKHAAPGGRAPQAPPAAKTVGERWRSLDETGNVRLLPTEELTVGHGTVVAAAPVVG